MKTDRTPITENLPFILADVKAFLRVDTDEDDSEIQTLASMAALEIEGAAEVALLAQTVTHIVTEWTEDVDLPVGPLWEAGIGDNPVTVHTRDEAGALTELEDWWIEGGKHPRLHLTATVGWGTLVITYPAGFGETAASIPADLTHAIKDHAVRLYDMRGDTEAGSALLSPAARRTVARHRRVRA